MSNVRVGGGMLGEYRVGSADFLDEWGDAPTDVVVDEVGTAVARNSEAHMSAHAYMFAPLSGDDPEAVWTRPNHDEIVSDMSGASLEAYGAESDPNAYLGLRFEVVAEDGEGTAYLDNARMETSGVLWELSPDGGATWYPVYDLPNNGNVRFSFPRATTRVRARAWSGDRDEWVRALAMTPVPNRQDLRPHSLVWNARRVYMDEFGRLWWEPVEDSVGDAFYEVRGGESLLGVTRDAHFQLAEWDFETSYEVTAIDEAGNSATVTSELHRLVTGGGLGFSFDRDGDGSPDGTAPAIVGGSVDAYWAPGDRDNDKVREGGY